MPFAQMLGGRGMLNVALALTFLTNTGRMATHSVRGAPASTHAHVHRVLRLTTPLWFESEKFLGLDTAHGWGSLTTGAAVLHKAHAEVRAWGHNSNGGVTMLAMPRQHERVTGRDVPIISP